MGAGQIKIDKGKSSKVNDSAVYYFESDTSKITEIKNPDRKRYGVFYCLVTSLLLFSGIIITLQPV